MSGKGGNNGKGNIGISAIPPGSRKIVQSLKEIVHNCTEQEIYAMLKDCNMDPNEAVNRLLAQDPFHEVKSKREKKKENKDTTDLRPRGITSSSNRGGKVGGDRYAGRGGPNQFSFNEAGAFYGKSAYKKENGTHANAGFSSSASGLTGNNPSRRPSSYSDSVSLENNTWPVASGDGISSSSQPSSGFQSAWVGVRGQVSMADIVKMGRPHAKVSATSNPPIHGVHHQNAPAPSSAHHNLHLSQDHGSKVSELHRDRGLISSEDIGSNDEWPSIEQPQSASLSSVLEAPSDSELYANSSNLPLDRVSQHLKSQLDEVQVAEDGLDETLNGNHIGHASVSGRNIQEDESGSAPVFENNSYDDMSSYQAHGHTYDHNKAEDSVSSMAANLEQLSLQKDDQGARPEEDVPAVVIPNHLQFHTPDCLNLSFGSFGSGNNATVSGSGSFASRSMKSNLEETSASLDAPAIGHSDSRNTEFYADEHLGTTSDGNLIRTGASTGEYDSSSVPQAEALKQETSEADQGNQYAFPSSAPGFSYESSQQLNVAFSHPQTSAQMQNLAPFSSVMTAREDLPYSPFPVTQSMPTKYNSVASSIGGPTMSVPEALRAASISTPQPTQQALPSGNVATGPALPQHLAVHPYSQPTLPLGHFANMIGYPFLPQSYTYMPSAFQQTFAGNSTYHQSLAAVLPQYKNSVSVSSLPQSAAIASAYGFGSSTSIPGGNFPVNPPTAPAGTTIGYEDVLSSQYKDANHLMSLQQQNDNSAMWVHGPGSRAMSAVPASTYYGFQGQNQQHAGFRQGQQQPSQQFGGALSYPNFYHSQSGMSLEHQQQNPRDASLGGSQGQPSKQSQQLWQNSY
ncbi:GBF-interacting protein [Parasponia andersonii]|uniref:GBF-interacting protein n=1 Tax=Parasponia andersonii TaxID=3476 RepID=A0A2P5AYY3_PARAD|nr:GBF-interacting protein [Parasponia andersonii]